MKKKWILVTVIVAVIAFLLHPAVFPNRMAGPMPTSTQLPFLILLTVFESIALGLGISFYIFAYPLIKKTSLANQNLLSAVYLSVGWILVNWWFHDGLHMINGMDLQGLLYIEYVFHLSLIIAGSVLAYAFFHILNLHKK